MKEIIFPVRLRMVMKIIVILNFARSGGTILAQLLNTFNDAWILSEINPQAGVASANDAVVKPELAIAQQAANWYGVQINKGGFLESIEDLANTAESQGKILVIRDWSYQNFRKTKQNNYQPSYRLELLEVLRNKFDLRIFAFVRDGIDVFLSVGGDIQQFGRDYSAYAQSLIAEDVEILKYEELVSMPLAFESKISQLTGIEWKINFNTYGTSPATGNLRLGKVSRGIRKTKLELLPRKLVGRLIIREIENCDPLMKANRILGYPDTYWNGNVENFFGMVSRRSVNVVYKTWQKVIKKIDRFQ